MTKNIGQRIIKKVKRDNERGARRAILEDLFYDFNRNRHQVYAINFARGIFFGLGTVIGGTVIVAFLIWILGYFVNWFPMIGDFISQIIEAMQRGK